MLGAIAGDVIGSPYEWDNLKSTRFPLFRADSRFTDDTVLTLATADALLTDGDYAAAYRRYARRYPSAGYGARFRDWFRQDGAPAYGSLGNGSAMRVSPVAYARDTLAAVRAEARRSAAATHDHPEGLAGAEAVAGAVFLARTGASRRGIREFIAGAAGYDLEFRLDAIRAGYRFDVTCRGSVPQAAKAFLESAGFEDAVRRAVSVGGDSDTIACICGAIAGAYYGGVPAGIAAETLARLDPFLVDTLERFRRRYPACAAQPSRAPEGDPPLV